MYRWDGQTTTHYYLHGELPVTSLPGIVLFFEAHILLISTAIDPCPAPPCLALPALPHPHLVIPCQRIQAPEFRRRSCLVLWHRR